MRISGGVVRGTLSTLAPSGLLALVTVALDIAVVHAHGTLAPDGALADGALALSVLSALAVLGLPGAVRISRIRRAGMREVDAMTGAEFEERLASLYRVMGYDVHHTGRRGDFGADLVVEREEERAVVQAKRYRGAVGIEAVQQVVGAARYYEADTARVVTNSTCTPAARALAEASGVELVERDALVRLLADYADTGVGAAWGTLAWQWVEGARLCVFTAGVALRLVWWLVRVTGRGLRAVRRGLG